MIELHSLRVVLEAMAVRMQRLLYLKRHYTHRTVEEVVQAHATILEAIRSGNAERAPAALQAHLQNVEATFRREIKKGEVLTETTLAR